MSSPHLILSSLCAGSLLLAACSTTPGAGGADAPATVTFLDSRIFDESLSRSLAAGHKEVTVETQAGVSIDRIPERMDKWLYTVSEANHKVVAQPKETPQMRSIGLVALIQAIATGTYGWLRENMTYAPARKYDATLIYDKATGNVERIVFKAIEPPAEGDARY